MTPLIRIATADDHAAWTPLRFQLWPDCPLERHRLEVEQLLRSGGQVMLAYVGEDAVGFAEVSIRADHVEGTQSAPVPYLEGWYVAPQHRSKGVGRALLHRVEEWAKAAGFHELASDAELENTHSIRLHSLQGFCEVGRTVHFVKPLR